MRPGASDVSIASRAGASLDLLDTSVGTTAVLPAGIDAKRERVRFSVPPKNHRVDGQR
jgi:hypothetical protein